MGRIFALRLSSARFLPLVDLDQPSEAVRLFTTLADGQRKAVFDFVFREGASGAWRQVGLVTWNSLPSLPAGEPTLELRLAPERAGSLLLRLQERSTGRSRSFSVRLPAGRPPGERSAVAGAPLAGAPSTAAFGAEAPVAEAPVALPAAARPAAARGRAYRWRLAAVLALVVVLLAAAFAVQRFTALGGLLLPARGRRPAAVKPAVAPPPRAESMKILPAPQLQPAAPAAPPARAAPAASPAPEAPAAPAREPARAPASRPPPAAPGEPAVRSHRVQWGDTLWRITQRYYGDGSLYDLLAGENALPDPNLIITGSEIRLPPRIDDQDRIQ